MSRFNVQVLVILLVCSQLSLLAQDDEIDPGIANKLKEIQNYEPVSGVWEGSFFIKSAPEQLMSDLVNSGDIEHGSKIRIVLSDDNSPEVYLN